MIKLSVVCCALLPRLWATLSHVILMIPSSIWHWEITTFSSLPKKKRNFKWKLNKQNITHIYTISYQEFLLFNLIPFHSTTVWFFFFSSQSRERWIWIFLGRSLVQLTKCCNNSVHLFDFSIGKIKFLGPI